MSLEHSKLIQALLQPDCYPHPVHGVTHIETHISDVFLTGPYAYKLKKPLDLGFLDFSTLEKRRRCCKEELRLNRRFAPELYLSVVPISMDGAHPRMAGDGVPVEYAVKMLQFEQAGLLDRLIACGNLHKAQVDRIAETVASFHLALPPSSAGSPYGDPATVQTMALQNFDQLAPLIEAPQQNATLDSLRRWTAMKHTELKAGFMKRRLHGCIRECHGDLHLGNMVLIDGRVRLFDCIEFNPELRWIDVMSEVAFVMMDLLRYQRRDLAYRFLNRYLEITGDYDGAAVLPYYVVYRALVRAKIAAMRAGQPGVSPQLQRSLQEKTNSHVSIAQQMASDRRPMLAILHGLSGSGKTVVSQAVLETIGAIRIRSDIERKRLHGLSPAARTGAQPGGGIYSIQAGAATYDRLTELTSQILDAGFPVLVDAAFLTREHREQMRNLAQAKKLPFAILHTHASEATLRQRIAQRAVDAGDASEADSDVLDWQLANQEPLTNAELRETFTFNTERQDPCALARQVAERFS